MPTEDVPTPFADRRTFLKTVGAATLVFSAPARGESAAAPVRFGLDLFSVRDQGWTPFQHLDFAAKWNVKVVHFSEIRFLGSLDADNLRRVRARADELSIDVEIGMRSICPSSQMFDPKAGTAEEQLGKMIDAARIVRSPIVRAVLGSQADRGSGIEKHIDNTAAVIRNMRSQLVDAGVKVAIENHAGDMQARELKRLIEAAGTDIAGVCLDSGNPVWTIEDPHLTLETLAPYVLTSHMRDSALWRTPEGIAVRWTRMGDGNMGMEDYLRKYVTMCPGRAVSLEVIVSGNPRMVRYQDPKTWDIFRTTPAWEFARFVALADKGQPTPAAAPDASLTAAQRQLADVEASIRWTQAFLAKL